VEQDLLWQETELLLKKLESLELLDDASFGPGDTAASTATSGSSSTTTTTTSSSMSVAASPSSVPTTSPRSDVSKDSLIIYLQVILSNIRHVQRPMSKLVGLQLLQRLAKYSSDEARLQRIVPTTVSLLQDQDSLVRAFCLQVMTCTLAMIQTFPPSDSNIFPQYIFKRVAPLINDSALVVRVTFARSVACLAETALSFLDVSHAVRLYEAVGGGGVASSAANNKPVMVGESKGEIFTDDVTKLLDSGSTTSSSSESTKKTNNNSRGATKSSQIASPPTSGPSAHHSSSAGKVLINTTYNAELAALHETISRWVAQLTVDPSEHSSAPKQALLRDLARLCTFFGRDGVLSFILPQVLAFLNDRKDWELRAALLEALPFACHMIGRASTQHFVLPCLETSLGDAEERVIESALVCLAELLDLGLIARSALIGKLPGVDASERNENKSMRHSHHHR
jgi:phosphoinositide-3-kinase regulatory subunit 4